MCRGRIRMQLTKGLGKEVTAAKQLPQDPTVNKMYTNKLFQILLNEL